MTKLNFYSLMRVGGKAQAILHNGYTDGDFNYYKNGSSWSAIHPLYGLSVASGATRKDAAEEAHQLFVLDGIARVAEQRGEKMQAEFNRLCDDAEKMR